MPEHSGLPVAGYKPQSEEKVALVNSFKQAEERLLRSFEATNRPFALDPRWTAIAKSHFEQGFMALNRAVFQPGRVALPEDFGDDDGDTPVGIIGGVRHD